jgi:hypothetical protein
VPSGGLCFDEIDRVPLGIFEDPERHAGMTVRGMTTRPPRRSTWASDAVMSGVSM